MDYQALEQLVRSTVQQELDKTHAQSTLQSTLNGPSRPHSARPSAARSGTARPNTARAAVLVAKEKLELREFPLRAITDDEILVRVEACGICGTDVHCYKNDPFDLIPVVLGHEGTGEVVEVGRNVTMDSVGHPVRVGDKIVTSLMEVSDECMVAKYNPLKANLCDDVRIYGLLPDEPDNHFNGWFGEYIIVRPGSSFFTVNPMSVALRCLIEPAAVCVHALERAKRATTLVNFRSRVIVQGCGPIGLMMIAAVRAAGVNTIIAIDGDEARLAMARRMGADHTLDFRRFDNIAGQVEAVRELTKGVGAHLGFQVTGVPQAASNLYKMVRRGGAIVEVGFFVDGGDAKINPHFDICKKEMTVLGSWAYNSWEYPNAYHFLQRAQSIGLPVESLVTHRFPLSRIEDAFRAAIAMDGVKVLVENT